MKLLDDGPEKQRLIDQLIAVAQRDAPWTMGFFPHASAAVQQWVHNSKPAVLIRDHGRYLRLDIPKRVSSLAAWNQPIWWPLLVVLVALLVVVVIARRQLRRRERMNARGQILA
jgi:hypothetical protein